MRFTLSIISGTFTAGSPCAVSNSASHCLSVLNHLGPDVNAPTEALEQAVIACIKADQPVFFGEWGAI